MVAGLVYLNSSELLSGKYLILMIALALFGSSVLLDALPLQAFSWQRSVFQLRVFLEDGLNFAGIVTWLAYFGRYAVQRIESIPRSLAGPNR